MARFVPNLPCSLNMEDKPVPRVAYAILRHMKQGGLRKYASGFTIVETLIVLAVTAAIFVATLAVINGRQSKTEFQTAINSITQQIQQIVNQTSSGYFPSNNSFQCSAGAAGLPNVSEGGSGTGQGTNLGCVFIGKVIQFGVHGTDPEEFITWPLAGNQNAQTVASSYPQPVQSIIDTQNLTNGLSAVAMYYNGASNQKTAGVAFLAGDSSGQIASSGANGLNSGSEQFSLYAIHNTMVQSTTQSSMYSALKAQVSGNNYIHVNSVQICFASGTTAQSGLVTIGNSSGVTRQLSVTLRIRGNTTCS